MPGYNSVVENSPFWHVSEGRVSEGRTFSQTDFDTEHFFKSVVHTVRNIFPWQIKRYHKLCFRCNTPVKMKPLWPTEKHQKMKWLNRMNLFLQFFQLFFNLWHLRHWLQHWQLRTWNHDNLCYLTINCDTGQHSQFLQCFQKVNKFNHSENRQIIGRLWDDQWSLTTYLKTGGREGIENCWWYVMSHNMWWSS